jgi:hypothetical protein
LYFVQVFMVHVYRRKLSGVFVAFFATSPMIFTKPALCDISTEFIPTR